MKTAIRPFALVFIGLLSCATSLHAQKDEVSMDDMRIVSIDHSGKREFTVVFTARTVNDGPAFEVSDAFGQIYKNGAPLLSGTVRHARIPRGGATVKITAVGTLEPGTDIIELIALYIFRRKDIYTLNIRFTETLKGQEPIINDWKDLYWKDFKHKNH